MPAAASLIALAAPAAQAQQLPVWQPVSPQYVQCPAPGQPLLQIPEIVSQNGKLRGTIVLSDNAQRMFVGSSNGDPSQCLLQTVRQFRASEAVLPAYAGSIPPGYPGHVPPARYPGYQPPPPPTVPYTDPVPGPTLRAKLGDIVELAFLNQLDSGAYWNTIDRGEKGQGCDQGGNKSGTYPGLDVYPDCFHGSTTGNIHFHGTHTNPGTTGDNVFIEVRPSLRDASGQPVVTEASISGPFGDFFNNCETELNKSVLSQWPRTWNDLPPAWVATQESLLKQYDANPAILNKLWPVDEAQRKAGAWPQYYIGATPYCFRLPAYAPPGPTQSARPAHHGGAAGGTMEQARALQMGQAPGTHWYHAHKHGSTTIDVANGMTGAFIIEGGYDDALNQFYGPSWTGPQSWSQSQPVLVVNQLGVSPNLFGGGNPSGGPLPFSVNGRFQPTITMQPGQVQLWRIANTSSRGAIFVNGFAPANATAPSSPQVFTWKQTAQDGVQFTGTNYASSRNPNLLLFAGNRADMLVQAPTKPGQYVLLVQQVRSRCATLPTALIPTIPTRSNGQPAPSRICAPDDASPVPFLMVNVSSGPAATGNQAQFIPPDQLQQSFPPFLADIKDSDVKGTRTVVFESTPTGPGRSPAVMHTIDGHKFDGNVGEVVLLNTVEEWKIVNNTVNGGLQAAPAPATGDVIVTTDPPGVVDHPFHIHINPFQVVEVFDPNEIVPDPGADNALIPKYVTAGTPRPVQCLLDPNDPTTWKDCHNKPQPDRIWWDVFGIPSARAIFTTQGQTIKQTTIPGYFKMRSRFVDYTGQYVIHCHILAHEDRGMMTVVEVVPLATAYSHQ